MYKFCLSHKYYNHMDNLNYQPVGQGQNIFPKHWMTDNTGDNICEKNKYYDMYTFHYWLWKNYLDKFEKEKWICFSTYRRFWEKMNFDNDAELKDKIIQTPPNEWKNFETILTEPTDLRNIKISKIWKKGKKILIKNPSVLFNRNKRNIKFHFDLMHYEGNLDKAVDLIDSKDKNEFIDYLNNETSVNFWNLFCCNSPLLLGRWYEDVFTWLFKCEKIFGFKNLSGYETGRIYAYLAERYLPFWFKKYSTTRTWPIYFYDHEKFNK